MIFMIPIVFLINVEKHDIILAFTFAVAIAICITPLLLPVILSSSLSKGAVRMSKKKTIVKKLDSIQNFGAMNIFCTDKTGTLTENKMKVQDVYEYSDTFLETFYLSCPLVAYDPMEIAIKEFCKLKNDIKYGEKITKEYAFTPSASILSFSSPFSSIILLSPFCKNHAFIK